MPGRGSPEVAPVRPTFSAQYGQDVAHGLAQAGPASAPVAPSDLAHLPQLLQIYLHRAGAVGQPRLRNFQVAFRGAMRLTRHGGWLSIHADQHTFLGPEPARFFLVRARRFGIPFEGYHRYTQAQATMQVRVASCFQVVDAQGPEMDRSETVTFFNDLCLLAPAALLDVDVNWAEAGAQALLGTFHHQGHKVSARLTFDAQGDLADFASEDRSRSSDGKTYDRLPWSTPVSSYAEGQGRRWMARGEAIWHEAEGAFPYARFEVVEMACNVGIPGAAE